MGCPRPRGGCPAAHLCHQLLVLAQPGLPHGRLQVEAPRQLLQLLLPDELIAQCQLPLVLRSLQLLPRLAKGSAGWGGTRMPHPTGTVSLC